MRMLLNPPMLPWKQAYLTYKLVTYAGEGWESQASVPPTSMRIFQYPIAMAFKFQHSSSLILAFIRQ